MGGGIQPPSIKADNKKEKIIGKERKPKRGRGGQFVGGRKEVARLVRGRKKGGGWVSSWEEEKKERKVRKKIRNKRKEEEEEEKRKGTGPTSCIGRTRTGLERNCATRSRCLPTSVLFYT